MERFHELLLKSVAVGLSDSEKAELETHTQSGQDSPMQQIPISRLALVKWLIGTNDVYQDQRRERVYTRVIGSLQFEK